MKRRNWLLIVVLVAVMLAAGMSSAEDGVLFRRNISKTPDQVTERANVAHMTFYVPAQSSTGELTPIDYYTVDGTLVDTRESAKPLVAVYIDGLPEEEVEGDLGIMSGAGFGAHDAHVALSLDDGATWKRTNLSMSADLSSFTLADGHPYPGDAHNMTFAIAGDKVLVGWISKYCDGGSPTYTFTDDEIEALQSEFGLPDLYVHDIWGVAGSQKSVDYTLQGFPEVGEIPYSCVWSARGQLLEVDVDGVPTEGGGFYDIVWTKAERLTSGRRDANRLEMNGDSAAGFMMTWQEDPDGLRPGQGLGPGEGWSGAVVNQQTDLWYSFISVVDFDQVDEDGDLATIDPIPLAEYVGLTMPKVAVPMAMPIRLTDNKKCMTAKGTENTESQQFPYCYVNFDDVDPYGATVLPDNWDSDDFTRSDNSTFCATTVDWENPGGTILWLCQAEDDRVLGGRVGASRPRVNVQPYDSDGDGVYESAWVIMGAEESKALGEGSTDDDAEPEDIGKNMWYYSFDLLDPGFVMQGGMLNQPAKCNPYDADDGDRCPSGEGEFYELLVDDFGNQFYETEIARRFAHFSQPIHQIGDSGVSAVLIVKQGILNQGGPADIFLRRVVVPDAVWVDCPADSPYERCLPAGYNPYAYENMACDEWVYDDGSNPRYVQGLCLSNMINVSSGTIVACDGAAGDCADQFPWEGGVSPFPKVTEWRQCDGITAIAGCEGDNDLDDQSWENPYDVAKGHRGFIDGDFIMMMYAWSPNWKANSVGNDHYNLYARRSFDGGLTWTTTPAETSDLKYRCLDESGEPADCDYNGDGTETCENYGAGSEYTTVCTTYGPEEFEQARNLSQLTGNKVTILDPRYSPTGGIKMLPITDLKEIGFAGYDDDVRDPSKFFMVYETGDNTTVAEGEAVPLDLFYSRATDWGDDYDLVDYETGDGEVIEAFDWLEHDHEDLSGEAANTCNPAGTFYYVVWNQWQEDEHENVSESDIIFRRLMYLPDDSTIVINPIASILYVNKTILSLAADDTLTIVGTAKGFGPDGEIEEVKWLLKPAGSEMDPVVVGTEKMLQMRAQEMVNQPGWAGQPGWAQLTFMARDKGGRWSPGVDAMVWIVTELHQVHMPMVIR